MCSTTPSKIGSIEWCPTVQSVILLVTHWESSNTHLPFLLLRPCWSTHGANGRISTLGHSSWLSYTFNEQKGLTIPDDPSHGPLQSNCTYRAIKQGSLPWMGTMLIIVDGVLLAHVVPLNKLKLQKKHTITFEMADSGAGSGPRDAAVMESVLKEMGVDDYDPNVVHQMLEFSYSEWKKINGCQVLTLSPGDMRTRLVE